MIKLIRVRAMRLLAGVAIGATVVTLSPILGIAPQTAAQAQYGGSVSVEFRTALSPYGSWRRHPRWGEVWVFNEQTPDWRPYTRGRWIYTDDWGWYWDVGSDESAWGWVAYHYGRWAFDPEFGWVWVPGEDWGPAWVDWRRGDDYVGWAPLPPDDVVSVYSDDPVYWSFVRPQYLLVPRVYAYFVPPRERVVIIQRTVIVNRTIIVDRNRDRDRWRGRVAVNAGIDPGIIAKATGRPIRAAKVEPAVLRGTKVAGTREVSATEGRRARAQVRETNTVIQPAAKVEPPKALSADEKGRLGNRPLKAVQQGNVGNDNRAGDNRPGNNRIGDDRNSRDNRRVQEPARNLRLDDQGRNRQPDDQRRSPPAQINGIRGNPNDTSLRAPSSLPANAIRGGSNDSGRRASPPPQAPGANDRFRQNGVQFRQSPPPPPPEVRRVSPPPEVRRASPPPEVRRPPSPPPQMMRQPPQQQVNQPRHNQEQRGGGNQRQKQQQDDPRR